MRIQVNARNRGFEFDARSRESVLYAGLRAGIDLPYECATGTCGTCKAKLISGRLHDGWGEAAGRKYVKPEQREFLMCQRAAEGAVMLEVSKFVYAMEPGACTPDACTGIVRAPRRLAHDVMAFGVELEQPRDFDAGQFVLLAPAGVPAYRAYSLCNFGRGGRPPAFVANRKGGRLEPFGPLGKAPFDPALARNLLCIAGGSGIAGMMSILSRAARERYFDRYRGWVFFGVRRMRDAFFLRELSAFKRQGLEITVALSDEDAPASAKRDWPELGFARGLVHEVAKRAMAGNYHDTRAYVAGPPLALDAAIRVLLLEAKLTTDNIRYDKFS